MTFDATWVLLGVMALIALIATSQISSAARSHDRQMDLLHKQKLELAREETMRLQLLVNASLESSQCAPIKRRAWWPGPPAPPPQPTQRSPS